MSVKGIVVDEQGKFLLSRERDGVWDMLGGGLEHEEDPLVGLRREVLEETGLKITWISPTPLYFITSPRANGKGYVANVIYEMKLENLDFTPSEECEELRFLSAQEAQNLSLFPTARKFVKQYKPQLYQRQ